MKKKIIATAMVSAILMGNTAFAELGECFHDFEGKSADPLNNDLFEIVAEVNSDIVSGYELYSLTDYEIDLSED